MPNTPPEAPPARRGAVVASIAALVVLVLIPYAGSLDADFAWLDHREIVDGALLVEGWGEFLGLFANDRNYVGYHRPFYNLMHSVDRAIWGLDPFGFHLSSLVLHGLNTVLVLLLARAIGLGRGVAFVTAALFGLHPVNTAVAGLVHSKADQLVVAAMLGAALCAWEGWRRGRLGWSAASLVLFALGTWCKETAFVYPVLFTAAALSGARPRGAGAAARGYLASLWILTALLVLQRLEIGLGDEDVTRLGLLDRLSTFLPVYVAYLHKLLLPSDLSVCDTVTVFYRMELFGQIQAIGGLIFVVGAQVVAWSRVPAMRKWIVLYNVALLPVAQIVPILHFRADRFLYLPSIAFVGALVEGCAIAAARVRALQGRESLRRALVGSAAVLLGAGYGTLVARRVPELHDDVTLFHAEILRTPDYREGLAVLGQYYQRAGRFDLAEPLLRRALIDEPARVSYVDLDGVILAYSHGLLALGRPDDARAFVRTAGASVDRAEYRLELEYNLAVAAYQLGEHAEALPLLRRYRTQHPEDANCLYLLGTSAAKVGEAALARDALSSYLRLRPDAQDRAEVEAVLAGLDG